MNKPPAGWRPSDRSNLREVIVYLIIVIRYHRVFVHTRVSIYSLVSVCTRINSTWAWESKLYVSGKDKPVYY
jgi:hypothetical protein